MDVNVNIVCSDELGNIVQEPSHGIFISDDPYKAYLVYIDGGKITEVREDGCDTNTSGEQEDSVVIIDGTIMPAWSFNEARDFFRAGLEIFLKFSSDSTMCTEKSRDNWLTIIF